MFWSLTANAAYHINNVSNVHFCSHLQAHIQAEDCELYPHQTWPTGKAKLHSKFAHSEKLN
jgi:hypothetical protein